MSKDTRIWAGMPATSGLLVAALMLTPAMAQADPEDTERTSATEQSAEAGSTAGSKFDRLDQDGDGYLSEQELQSAQDISADHEQLDADSDGQISRTEFAAVEGSAGASDRSSETSDPWSSDQASEESSDPWSSDQASEESSDPWSDDPQTAQSGSEQQGAQQQQSGQGSEALSELTSQERQLSRFVEAVEQAGLADALTGGTQYTIFAPTDDAFEQSDRSLDELMQPGNQEELVNVLRAHIVADDVDPEMAKRIGQAQTIGGGSVQLTSEGEELRVGDARVVKSDIQQGNLRVYAIDGVLEAGEPMTASAGQTAGGQESTAGQESTSGEDATFGETSSESAAGQTAMGAPDFDELDQDGDGYLSQEELQSADDPAIQQDQLDTDNDGQVSRTEFAAFERESGTMQDQGATQDQGSTDGLSGSDMPPHNEGEQQEWSPDEE